MWVTEYGPLIAAGGALIASVAAVVQKRRTPQLDGANVDLIKTEVREANAEYNAQRDLELIQWQSYVFNKIRPWGREVVILWDRRDDLLRELARKLGTDVEEQHLPPFPDPPSPPGQTTKP